MKTTQRNRRSSEDQEDNPQNNDTAVKTQDLRSISSERDGMLSSDLSLLSFLCFFVALRCTQCNAKFIKVVSTRRLPHWLQLAADATNWSALENHYVHFTPATHRTPRTSEDAAAVNAAQQ